MIAYVTTQGARIEREGHRLIVRSPDSKRTLFASRLEQLVLFGNVSLTPPALFLLMQEDIDTIFLRADGRYMGRLENREKANVLLRKRQFLLTEDSHFCLGVARRIVQAKILNQATLLARIKRSRQKEAAGIAAENLRRLALLAEQAHTVESLRGLEGRAATVYFQHFSLGFVEDWGFTRRVRRPPTDPVNAVLSLLYTLLINRCYAAVRQAGLDPQPAVLHGLAYGRDALPLDLVEEFRTMLGDALTLSLFNLRVLDWKDFEVVEPEVEPEDDTRADAVLRKVLADPVGAMSPEPELPVPDATGDEAPLIAFTPGKRAMLLSRAAFKAVMTAFFKKLDTEFFHPVAEKRMSYGDSILFQARLFRRVVEGETGEYTPLMLR